MSESPPIADTQPRPVPPVEGLAPGTVSAWIAWAARHLEGTSPSARADAEILMAAQLGVERSRLRLRDDEAISAALALAYAGVIERRRMGEPVAYLTGRQGFWTLDLEITPAALIPRADTETLVEWALQLARAQAGALRVLDLGTGSGAIALALAQELGAQARVLATDRSEAALHLARHNAHTLGLCVEFRSGDWCAALDADARFEMIVSNPPYIADGDPHLDALRYEPRAALTAGADGLDAIRALVRAAPAHLAPGGWLLLEHGHDQGAAVRALLTQGGLQGVETRRDFGGRERVSGGQRP